RPDGRAGGDPDEQTLLLGGPAGDVDGVRHLDVDHLVVDAPVEDGRDEVRADAHDRVRPGLAAVEDGRRRRLDRDDLHVALALLEPRADAGDRPAGADAGDERVDLAVRVVPDLLGGGGAVDLWVRLVLELADQDRALLLTDLLGPGDRTLH